MQDDQNPEVPGQSFAPTAVPQPDGSNAPQATAAPPAAQSTYTQQPPLTPVGPATPLNPPALAPQLMPEPVASASVNVAPAADGAAPSFLDKGLELLFVYGFATIFLVNAVYAVADPGGFKSILEENPIANAIGFHDVMLWIITVNDFILGALIIWGRYKKYVYAWAGVWLLLIAGMKLMNLVA